MASQTGPGPTACTTGVGPAGVSEAVPGQSGRGNLGVWAQAVFSWARARTVVIDPSQPFHMTGV